MTITCTCERPLATGPGMLAADLAYHRQIRAERTAGGRRFRSRRDDFNLLRILSYLVSHLDGDAPVRVDVAHLAEEFERSEALLGAELDWLAEHRFVYLDGRADGVVRVWVNPAVGVCGADPRTVAARHRFPYFVVKPLGARGPEPVQVVEYDREVWEQVFADNYETLTRQTFPSQNCRACFRPQLRQV
ncbi:hypothetical protein [Kitasatospora sp. NPDC002965]|uniref:hypothetical protein n=1 Tax=Kitasatospora sp. NPDC002965 TaxID=3154775 RepID=UPI0033A52BFF